MFKKKTGLMFKIKTGLMFKKIGLVFLKICTYVKKKKKPVSVQFYNYATKHV